MVHCENMGKVKLVIFSGFTTKVTPVITHRNDARDLFSSMLLVRHTFIKYSMGDSSPKEAWSEPKIVTQVFSVKDEHKTCIFHGD